MGFLDPRQWSRPDSALLQVLWTPWSRSRWKLINEINRFPSGKQNMFLEILQKKKVSYGGQVMDAGDTCYFATMNPDFSPPIPWTRPCSTASPFACPHRSPTSWQAWPSPRDRGR